MNEQQRPFRAAKDKTTGTPAPPLEAVDEDRTADRAQEDNGNPNDDIQIGQTDLDPPQDF